jgi:hypothetical protein
MYVKHFLPFVEFIIFSFSQAQCNYDAGTPVWTYNTGGFPYLLGGDDYSCHVLAAVDNYDSTEIGFSGFCEGSSTYYGFLAAADSSLLNKVKFYPDYPYGFKCTSKDDGNDKF